MSGAVTIRRCASAEEAAIVCGLLNDAGIPARLENWHHAMIDWGVLQALGGVGVLVPASQLLSAKQAIIDYAETAQERLATEFDNLEHSPPEPNRLRFYILIAFFTGLFHLPLIALAALVTIADRVFQDAQIYGFEGSLIILHIGSIKWLSILITHIIAAAYFLVPLSIFVFLGRRFLKQREERKLTQ